MRRFVWNALVLGIIAVGCTQGGPSIQPLKTALQNYFGGGYLIYSLPGRGPYYVPGALLRYQEKAEVLVWPRERCFNLETVKSVAYAPRSEWSDTVDVGASLNVLIPQAAVTLEPELRRKAVERTTLQFGNFELESLVEGAVIQHQKSDRFAPECREEYGKKRFLVLGTVGSKLIRFKMNSGEDLDAALGAKLQNLPIGGKASIRKSTANENVMEVTLDEPIIIGYIPGLLLKEEGGAPPTLGGPEEGTYRVRPLSIDEAAGFREGS
jgi:hypothetical protein